MSSIAWTACSALPIDAETPIAEFSRTASKASNVPDLPVRQRASPIADFNEYPRSVLETSLGSTDSLKNVAKAIDSLIISAFSIASGCEYSSAGIEASDHNGLWMRAIFVSHIAIVEAER